MAARVGARELKARLGAYIRRVRAGEILVITERGLPVAELRPAEPAGSDEAESLARLLALGVLTRLSERPLDPLAPVAVDIALARAVAEEREERR